MAEYIEREAAMEMLQAPITMSMCLSVAECQNKRDQRAIDAALIKSIPAADVVPVRHGRWIEVGVDKDDDGIPMLIMFGCNQCHAVSWTATPFCGYCGANMDSEA